MNLLGFFQLKINCLLFTFTLDRKTNKQTKPPMWYDVLIYPICWQFVELFYLNNVNWIYFMVSGILAPLTFDHDHVYINGADGRLRETLSFLQQVRDFSGGNPIIWLPAKGHYFPNGYP